MARRLIIRYHLPAESGEPQTDEAHVVLERLNATAAIESAVRAGYIVATHWHNGSRMYIPWHRVVDIVDEAS